MAERQFNLVCFETLKFGEQSHTYETYRKIGGYDVWEKVLRGVAAAGLTVASLALAGGAGIALGTGFSVSAAVSAGVSMVRVTVSTTGAGAAGGGAALWRVPA